MSKIKNMFSSSAAELTKVRVLTVCAMLAALAIVLQYVASINIGPYIKIGFSGIPNQIVDLLFGPITGGLFAGVMDIVKFMLKPEGTFDFRYTLVAMLAAFIYGCFYYKRPISIVRIFIAKFVIMVVVNLGLNTYLLSTYVGKGFLAILPPRILKNVIMWPIESIIFFLIVTAIEKTGVMNTFMAPAKKKVAVNE